MFNSRLGLLGDQGNEFVRLLSVVAHFVQLPAHGLPLKVSDQSTSNSRTGNDPGEHKLPMDSYLKILYLFALFVISVAIWHATWTACSLIQRRSIAIAIGSIGLLVFFAIDFHIAWAFVNWF